MRLEFHLFPFLSFLSLPPPYTAIKFLYVCCADVNRNFTSLSKRVERETEREKRRGERKKRMAREGLQVDALSVFRFGPRTENVLTAPQMSSSDSDDLIANKRPV